MKSIAIGVTLALGSFIASPEAACQSISQIGIYDTVWGWNGGPIAITPDGEWIAYMQGDHLGTCLYGYNFAMVRADGTGTKVPLPGVAAAQFYPTSSGSFPTDLSLTEDASLLYWWWPDHYTGVQCFGVTPQHWYRTETATGATQELLFGGFPIANMSHSDDGQVFVFKGWDAALHKFLWHKSGPDLSTAVPFLDPAPWTTTFGTINAQGTKFAFIGDHGFSPFPADVYVSDLRTLELVKVSPAVLNDLSSVTISADGSRVAYSGSNQTPLFGVNSDGSGHHVISTTSATATATLTRDGAYVVYMAVDAASGKSRMHRTKWDGSATTVIQGWNVSAGAMRVMPVNSDGSTVSILTPPDGFGSLSVWFEHSPVLTTYGYGYPGTPMYWDVGGAPGGLFLLAYAFGPASIPVGLKGTFKLNPATFGVLATGTIVGASNIGAVSVMLPAGLVVPAPVDLHFQALAFDATGHNGRFTDSTIFTIKDPSSAATWSGGPGNAGPGDASMVAAAPQAAEPETEPGAADIIRERALMDPNFAQLLRDLDWH